jgi:hypothetical protein
MRPVHCGAARSLTRYGKTADNFLGAIYWIAAIILLN